MEKIADAIDEILKSNDINLSDRQIEILSNMTDQEKLIFEQADQTITLGKVQAGWRQAVVRVAKTVLLLVAEARRGVELFKLGKNAEQEGILDFKAIENLVTIVERTKIVYTKLDAYMKSLPGYIPTSDADEEDLSAMVVFG